jgi:hypothetical protein
MEEKCTDFVEAFKLVHSTLDFERFAKELTLVDLRKRNPKYTYDLDTWTETRPLVIGENELVRNVRSLVIGENELVRNVRYSDLGVEVETMLKEVEARRRREEEEQKERQREEVLERHKDVVDMFTRDTSASFRDVFEKAFGVNMETVQKQATLRALKEEEPEATFDLATWTKTVPIPVEDAFMAECLEETEMGQSAQIIWGEIEDRRKAAREQESSKRQKVTKKKH